MRRLTDGVQEPVQQPKVRVEDETEHESDHDERGDVRKEEGDAVKTSQVDRGHDEGANGEGDEEGQRTEDEEAGERIERRVEEGFQVTLVVEEVQIVLEPDEVRRRNADPLVEAQHERIDHRVEQEDAVDDKEWSQEKVWGDGSAAGDATRSRARRSDGGHGDDRRRLVPRDLPSHTPHLRFRASEAPLSRQPTESPGNGQAGTGWKLGERRKLGRRDPGRPPETDTWRCRSPISENS